MGLTMNEIRKLVKERKIKWQNHMIQRMRERNITRTDVLECIQNGEIIEEYEKDYPYPSCLILGRAKNGNALHVVCAVGEGWLWLKTAYHPFEDEWCDDFKTRRKKI
ncbi:DUF4258 domain-containing protein [Anaerocellum danielii]|uniref:DUF4258 domain-containing protein n=1 Tax=Anaerocellum danielii TaxID=1387557 RepID=A0ABZ0U4V0_9FIRM|nr:DUF4258 domain-containing protein [Caldicellulosiruptor danielii]WPX08750.1 DUF4258 domain-containing protein [Caldicellulosiruptor danielii]